MHFCSRMTTTTLAAAQSLTGDFLIADTTPTQDIEASIGAAMGDAVVMDVVGAENRGATQALTLTTGMVFREALNALLQIGEDVPHEASIRFAEAVPQCPVSMALTTALDVLRKGVINSRSIATTIDSREVNRIEIQRRNSREVNLEVEHRQPTRIPR